jgi:hypothetical protein
MLKVLPLLQELEDASGCECVSLNKATAFLRPTLRLQKQIVTSFSHGTKYYRRNVEIFEVRGNWKFLKNI